MGAGALGAAAAPADRMSEALEAALSGAPFIKFKSAMQAADLLTTAGRRRAFEAATKGNCLLSIRLLLAGEPSLAKRDSALGALMGLRPFLPEWFTYVASVDSAGVAHPGVAKWCITGVGGRQTAFLDLLLKQDFHSMNWIGAHDTPGLYTTSNRRETSIL